MTDWNGKVHPAAEVLPIIEDDVAEMVADIRDNGLLQPGRLLPDGTLLDGRLRRLACQKAGVAMRWDVYDGDDPVGLVVSANLHRRHLTTGQKAAVAAELESLFSTEAAGRRAQAAGKPRGRKQVSVGADCPPERSRDRAARLTATSGRSVSRYKRLRSEAPDLAEKVRAGTLALDKASKQLTRRISNAEELQARRIGAKRRALRSSLSPTRNAPVPKTMERGATPSTPTDRAPRFPCTRSHTTTRNAGSQTRLNRSSNRRPGSSPAHRCNLVWISSTRRSAVYRSGHDAPVFTNVLLVVHYLHCELAGSLRHVAGFPGLGLLRTLRPVPGRSADHVPCRRQAGCPEGRRTKNGSHVHHRPFDGIGAKLFPCRHDHDYPAALRRGSRRQRRRDRHLRL